MAALRREVAEAELAAEADSEQLYNGAARTQSAGASGSAGGEPQAAGDRLLEPGQRERLARWTVQPTLAEAPGERPPACGCTRPHQMA